MILIHHGELLYDGALSALAARLAPFKLVKASLANGVETAAELNFPGVDLLENENSRLVYRVARCDAPAFIGKLLNLIPVIDLAVEDPPLEAVIDQIYEGGVL